MAEKVSMIFEARDEASGRITKLSKELSNLNKASRAAGSGAQAGASAFKQYATHVGQFGLKLERNVVPALKLTKAEMQAVQRQAAAMGTKVVQANSAFGLTRTGADAFSRAATRATAAMGFISPTAATAVAQLQGLTSVSAGATLALAAGAVGAIALATALIGSAKAAINFETSFGGIRKTVDLSEKDFKRLEQANRSMALSLPISVNEINRIGETAGALGITGVKNIEAFEKAVAQVAISTNVTADEAAVGFGKLANVMKIPVTDVDRLAATLVDLGNKGASTESQILEMALRIAGASRILGITTAQVLGIASAFSSVGIQAEAGGTAIQRVMIGMTQAVAQGGEELQTFATVAGMTAEQFRALVKAAPAEAFIKFVEGLKTAGDQAITALDELGLADARLIRSFLSAANAEELLRFQTTLATAAWQENTAAAEETARKTEQTSAQLQLAKNNVIDLGISIGNFLLPYINTVLQGIILLTKGLRELGSALGFASGKAKGLGISFKDTLKHVSPVLGTFAVIGDVVDRFSGSSDAADTSAEHLGTSLASAGSGAATLDSNIAGLTPDVAALGTTADDVRKKLFSMFSAPTLEEAQAQLAVLGLQRELNNLETQMRPLTEAEKERAETLSKYLIPSAQRLADQERLYSDILSKQLTIAVGNLQSREQLTQAAMDQANAVTGLNTALGQTPTQIQVDNSRALKKLDEFQQKGLALASQKFAFQVDIRDEEVVRDTVERLMEEGKALEAQSYAFRIKVEVDGYDAAIKQIYALIQTGNVFAAQAEIFRLGAKGVEAAPQVALPPFPEVGADAKAMQDLADASEDALTVEKALSDGIINLKEAMELGLTATDAAVLELGHDFEELQNRAFRATVELGKLYVRLSDTSSGARELQIALAESSVELATRALDARNNLNLLYVQLTATGAAAAEAAVLLAEEQGAAAESAYEAKVQFAALDIILGRSGLTAQAFMFKNALLNLGVAFGTAENDLQKLARIASEAFKSLQSQFDALFNRPTQESAALQLSLAQLQRQRLLREQAGATDEQLKPLDAQIERIQQTIALRDIENDILKAQATLADKTLLTDQEQVAQAFLLIGVIAQQSVITDQLNTQLAYQVLAQAGATNALNAFTSALQAAHGELQVASPGVFAPRTAAGTQGTAANIQVNVRIDPQLADIKNEVLRTVDRELEKKLGRARFSGISAMSGVLRP